ncbi:MAG: hypothetical protein ABI847_06210 [Anaerolineales bacterium]
MAVVVSALLTRSVFIASDTTQRVRLYIRDTEFDFVGWTFDAIGVQLRQNTVGEQLLLPEAERTQVVRRFFKLRAELDDVEAQISTIYTDPNVADPLAATSSLRTRQASLRFQMRQTQPLTEAILQEQLSVILAEQGLAVGGAPQPPVAFHLTALPYALIVSPRDVIRQDVNVDVNGDLTLDQQVALEDEVARSLDVSALAVPLGGIGTYPTMVGNSRDLNWLASVIAHEWTHNYLTLRPLGVNYGASGALRTMNETTAEMIGNELGALMISRYYPELAPPPQSFQNILQRDQLAQSAQAPNFDFRAEMHDTRVTADNLLAQGKIEEAEAYMEARRRVLWDHGYRIRKLNQAYFAFYGAYGTGGGGAAGVDIVGDAVRLLRRRSPSIAAFVNTMATFSTFEQLQAYLGQPAG